METKEEKQLKLDKRYIRMASIWAENSYCERRQVGALIVKDKMIISDGYNGTPAGFENVCEDDNGVTKPYVLHAEANAITKIARSNNSSDDHNDPQRFLVFHIKAPPQNGCFLFFSIPHNATKVKRFLAPCRPSSP